MEEVKKGEHLVFLQCHVYAVCGACRGMRSGTVPHTLAVGLGAACDIASAEMEVGVSPR